MLASSKSSGRMPRMISLPTYSFRREWSRAALSSTGSVCSPKLMERCPFVCASCASTRLIAGEPMKPATNSFTGWS